MKTGRLHWLLALILVLGFAGSGRCQSSDGQSPGQQPAASPDNGPAPQPGETVIVPKKKASEPAPVPEKKPERINPKDVFTISTTTNLVNLDVLVTDKDGSPISKLQKQNFKVLDDGVPQAISNFGTAAAPITVCMLIEFSSRSWAHLYLALTYSYQFLNFIQPQDWVAVVEYDMKPHILTDFTQDRGTIRSALDTLRIPGFEEANFFDALSFTIDRMKDIPGRKAIIPIVGGAGSRMMGLNGIDTFSKITYPDMLKIAKASDTPIYPITTLEYMDVRNPYGGGMSYVQSETELKYIAQYSGGQAYFPRFEAEIPADYQQIAQQLRTEYSIGFIPSNPVKDGKYHKLTVQLVDSDGSPLRIVNEKGKPVKYRLSARDGYYAPKS
jgi:VWFA-related protein